MVVKGRLRDLNIWFPWFKVVATVMIVLMAVFAMLGAARRGNEQDMMREAEIIWVNAAETAEGTGAEEVEETGGAETGGTEAAGEHEAQPGVAETAAEAAGAARAEELARRVQGKKLIALTFDDGPAPGVTPRLLDILQEKKAKATFFVVGKMAQAAPEIIQRAEREGHMVGSHTMGHVDLTALDTGAMQQDTAAIDAVFTGVLGRATQLVRPPYGKVNGTVQGTIRQPLVTWTVDPRDWATRDAGAIRRHVIGAAFDGAIVLMHDIYGSTADAVGGMIDELRGAGYEFVTVPEMAQVRGVKLEPGVVYGGFRP